LAPLDWLTKDRDIAEEVVIPLGLRFCGREYQDIMRVLKERFGEDALRGAGLLKRSQTKTDAFRWGLLAVSSSVVLTERL
jgi:hypothetical protein